MKAEPLQEPVSLPVLIVTEAKRQMEPELLPGVMVLILEETSLEPLLMPVVMVIIMAEP